MAFWRETECFDRAGELLRKAQPCEHEILPALTLWIHHPSRNRARMDRAMWDSNYTAFPPH